MKNFTAILAALVLTCACNAALEENYNKQETRIESFITSQTNGHEDMRVVHNNGAHRIVLKEGEGEELQIKGNVAFYYAGYIFTGNSLGASNLFTTNKMDIATGAKWNLTEDECVPFVTELSEKELLKGLFNGLQGVKAGEECYILFSGKNGFGKHNFGTVPANSALCYHIWVDTISND